MENEKDDHFPDLDQMDRDELEGFTNQLHEALHEQIYLTNFAATWSNSMGLAMVEIAEILQDADRFGKRSDGINNAILQLSVLAASTLVQFSQEDEDAETDSVSDKFADIISTLAEDPTFNKEGAGDADDGTDS